MHGNEKRKLSFIVSAIMALLVPAVIGIGLMIKYVLLSGTVQREISGSNTRLYFLGMDRHEWGEIHFILGMILSLLAVVHIILHWDSIVCTFRQLISNRPARYLVAVFFALVCALLIALPLLMEPDPGAGRHHKNRGWGYERLNIAPQ